MGLGSCGGYTLDLGKLGFTNLIGMRSCLFKRRGPIDPRKIWVSGTRRQLVLWQVGEALSWNKVGPGRSPAEMGDSLDISRCDGLAGRKG